MSILFYNGLPEEIDGNPISADFRNMLQVDAMLQDSAFPEHARIENALRQLYPVIPEDIKRAIDGLAWFLGRGEQESSGSNNNKAASALGYDFEQDAALIYAAFYATYGFGLTAIDFLHWWEFLALLEGLPETTLFKKVVYWRTTELDKLPKEERQHILKMRKLFALKRQPTQEKLDLATMQQRAKDRVAQRFAQAEKRKAASP